MGRLKETIGYALEKKIITCNAGHSGITGTNTFATDDGTCFVDKAQTNTTIIYPVSGLHVGDKINQFRITGALGADTAKATVVDANLRKVTGGAGSVTDASVATITQVSVVTDTALDSEATAEFDEVVATDYQYYVLVKISTYNDDANDASITGVEVDVNQERP